MLLSVNTFCTDTANAWQVVGYILTIFKIIIPCLLIIYGMFDLGKAVISNKEDEIKKSTKTLLRRAIAAVIIFFIPTIVSVIMGLIQGFNENRENYNICRRCLTNPNSNDCKKRAEYAWNSQK